MSVSVSDCGANVGSALLDRNDVKKTVVACKEGGNKIVIPRLATMVVMIHLPLLAILFRVAHDFSCRLWRSAPWFVPLAALSLLGRTLL
jgi:hypothetical protein